MIVFCLFVVFTLSVLSRNMAIPSFSIPPLSVRCTCRKTMSVPVTDTPLPSNHSNHSIASPSVPSVSSSSAPLNSQKGYFPWNDGYDYDDLCHRILSALDSPNNKLTIVNSGANGGLGHKYYSMVESMLYALILRRNYKIAMPAVFWNASHSCLSALRYDGPLHGYTLCDSKHKCMIYSNVWTMRKVNLLVSDVRVDLYHLGTPQVVRHLRSLGLMKPNEWWGSFCAHLLRLLLNPAPEITARILAERERIGPAQYQVGIHVRCGGKLADSVESVGMVSPGRLKKVPNLVNRLIKNSNIPRDKLYLFLSTDSTDAAKSLTQTLQPHRILSSNVFYRGHSRMQFVNDKSLIRTYVDLFLLCQSKSVLLTSSSSFSRLIAIMSTANPKYYIQARRYFV